MRIKFVCGIASDRKAYSPGDIADWPDIEAERLINAGSAERCEAVEIETAAVAPAETMAKRRGRPRKAARVAAE